MESCPLRELYLYRVSVFQCVNGFSEYWLASPWGSPDGLRVSEYSQFGILSFVRGLLAGQNLQTF